MAGGHIRSYFLVLRPAQGLIGATVFHSISVAEPSLGAL